MDYEQLISVAHKCQWVFSTSRLNACDIEVRFCPYEHFIALFCLELTLTASLCDRVESCRLPLELDSLLGQHA